MSKRERYLKHEGGRRFLDAAKARNFDELDRIWSKNSYARMDICDVLVMYVKGEVDFDVFRYLFQCYLKERITSQLQFSTAWEMELKTEPMVDLWRHIFSRLDSRLFVDVMRTVSLESVPYGSLEIIRMVDGACYNEKWDSLDPIIAYFNTLPRSPNSSAAMQIVFIQRAITGARSKIAVGFLRRAFEAFNVDQMSVISKISLMTRVAMDPLVGFGYYTSMTLKLLRLTSADVRRSNTATSNIYSATNPSKHLLDFVWPVDVPVTNLSIVSDNVHNSVITLEFRSARNLELDSYDRFMNIVTSPDTTLEVFRCYLKCLGVNANEIVNRNGIQLARSNAKMATFLRGITLPQELSKQKMFGFYRPGNMRALLMRTLSPRHDRWIAPLVFIPEVMRGLDLEQRQTIWPVFNEAYEKGEVLSSIFNSRKGKHFIPHDIQTNIIIPMLGGFDELEMRYFEIWSSWRHAINKKYRYVPPRIAGKRKRQE